ncbi:hypothetical protein DFH09DRAFT_981151 [Mycena vulgaris]|nr:hypothetical protein DFH09DRAFT_981151 [Mycena vulgaris]
MNAQHHSELLRKVSATPSKYIQTARHQSGPGLSALLDLSMIWAGVPQIMELGIIDMLLSHLRAEKAPASSRRKWQRDADFANLSLFALGAMEPFIDDPRYQTQSRAVVSAWPGIFKWCSYIYDARVASASAEDRRMFLDTLVKLFYVLSRFNQFVMAMIGTPGCLELVTKFWALEDIPAGVESIVQGPIPTATLALLLKCSALLGKNDIYKRVTKAAGGDSDFVVQLVLARVKKLTKAMDPDRGALALSWHIDLICELCLPSPHPLRRAFFDANVIPTVTSAFVALSCTIVDHPTPNCVLMMVSCFAFFSRYLEGDDYPSLVHATKAGFLAAFLDCSPTFRLMPAESVEVALNIIRQVLPRYLVYRSFIEAVNAALKQFQTPHYEALIAQPHVQAAWGPFVGRLTKWMSPLEHTLKLKSEGSPVQCDYVHCQLLDVKNSFSKCGACKVVYYCSPECQRLAWRSSHRTACKQLKAEQDGHRNKGRPKADREFLHGLSQWEADVNFAIFHDLAERHFPNTPHADLMPCVDFNKVPPEYSIKVIEPGASGHPTIVFSAADTMELEARFQGMAAKYRGTGQTIVQSVIASGATVEILTTLMSRKNFWTDKNTYSDSSDEDAEGWVTESEANDEAEDQSKVTPKAWAFDDLD